MVKTKNNIILHSIYLRCHSKRYGQDLSVSESNRNNGRLFIWYCLQAFYILPSKDVHLYLGPCPTIMMERFCENS